MPEHYGVGTNVIRGTVSFFGGKKGRAYFINDRGQRVSFTKAPIVQLTPTDTTLSPAWKSKFLKEDGRFVGLEIAFSNAQVNQTVEWTVMSA